MTVADATAEIDIHEEMLRLGHGARDAAKALAKADTETKNTALKRAAAAIREDAALILAANERDMEAARHDGVTGTFLDRLALDQERIEAMAKGLEGIAGLDDPVGDVIGDWTRPNGLRITRVRVPLGVIGVIYESRPNVTADAAALCLKSGNAVILRGGSESFHSSRAIVDALHRGLAEAGLPKSCAQLVPTTDRAAVGEMLSMAGLIDIIVPRGGKSLIERVTAESRIPVIKHLDGICHVYVDKYADLDQAINIAFNAKTYRYGICGAMETLLIHEEVAVTILPKLLSKFTDAGVELRGCEKTRKIIDSSIATDEDWVTEYLAPILSIRVVQDIDSAISHINQYGSAHTDSIVTSNEDSAESFMRKVDSSSVMHNVPTCWADGFEYGLGAEVGISTDKIHARGPVGLEGLTSQKYIVKGQAQIRGA